MSPPEPQAPHWCRTAIRLAAMRNNNKEKFYPTAENQLDIIQGQKLSQIMLQCIKLNRT